MIIFFFFDEYVVVTLKDFWIEVIYFMEHHTVHWNR